MRALDVIHAGRQTWRTPLAFALLVVTALAAPVRAQVCSGDCDGDTVVTNFELLSGVGIALDDAPVNSCTAADTDRSGTVRVADLVAAANAALGLQCIPPGSSRAPAGVVSIDVGVVAGTAGATVDVPVTLDSGGLTVAGIQNDIAFDPLTPVAPNLSNRPDCTANPAHGKDVFTSYQPPGCTFGVNCTGMRALVLSLFDVDPIPDGLLYTCKFNVSPLAMQGTYLLINSNTGSSDPIGNSQATHGADGAIVVGPVVDTDLDGVIDGLDNCLTTPNPDQSDVDEDGAGDVCDPNDGPTTLVLSVARLRTAPSASAARGMLKVRALLNDNDSSGQFETQVLSNGLTVTVESANNFYTTWSFPACQHIGHSDRIRCRTSDRRRRATFQPSGQGPLLYKVRIGATNLTQSETNVVRPTAPVTVTLRYGAIDRVDSIATCAPSQTTGLACVER